MDTITGERFIQQISIKGLMVTHAVISKKWFKLIVSHLIFGLFKFVLLINLYTRVWLLF